MTVSTCKIFAEILLVLSLSKAEDLCSDEEPRVIKTLGASLGVNSFTFVQDNHDPGTLQKIRDFAGSRLFSAVTNSEGLDRILSDELRRREFIEKRTIIVTKETLNFTRALEQLAGTRSVTWAVFVRSFGEMQNSYIPINANMFTLRCMSTTMVLNKAYHLKPGLRLTVETVQGAGGALKVFRNPKVDFERVMLTVNFLSSEEECRRTWGTKHVLTKIECFHQEIVDIIAERMNATTNKTKCPEHLYPYNYPNGTLSEMYLVLFHGETDLSSGSYIINNERLKLFNFAWPVFTTRSMMYIKYESVSNSWRAFLRPVEERVWRAMFSWIFLTGVLLQFFQEFRRKHFKFGFSFIPGFIKSLFISLQVFCNQGVHNIPKWTSTRIVFAMSFLVWGLLYEAYCAFLISSLTVTAPNIPFTDLEEFFSDGTYKILTLKRGFHNYYIKKTLKQYGVEGTDFLHDPDDLPETSQSGINKLCEREGLTYIEFRENIVQNEIECKIKELPKPILRHNTGLGLPKNSPYKEILNQHVTVLRSTGVLHRMKRYLLSYVTLEEKDVSNELFIHVSLWHVVSIFSVMGVGAVASIVIFLLEVFCNFLNNRKIPYKHVRKRKTLKIYVKEKRFGDFWMEPNSRWW